MRVRCVYSPGTDTTNSTMYENMFFNTLRPRQKGRHFADDIFKWIFLNENVWISIKIALKFVPRGLISNIPVFVQIMAWRRPGDKPLSEPMMVSLLTHICVTRPQWVNTTFDTDLSFNDRLCTKGYSVLITMSVQHGNGCNIIQANLFHYVKNL